MGRKQELLTAANFTGQCFVLPKKNTRV